MASRLMLMISIVAKERRAAYRYLPMAGGLWRLSCDIEHATYADQEAFLF